MTGFAVQPAGTNFFAGLAWIEGDLARGLAGLGQPSSMTTGNREGAELSAQAPASFPAITPWGSWPVSVDTGRAGGSAKKLATEQKLLASSVKDFPREQGARGSVRALPKANFPTTATPRSKLPSRFAPVHRGHSDVIAKARPNRTGARLAGLGALLVLAIVALPALWIIWSLPPLDVAAAARREAAVAPGTPVHANLAHVPRQDLPADLVNAVLAIEDRRFHDHFGLDPRAIARAALRNYRAGEIVQGGSTITQQLAKVLYLSPEQTMRRKLQEAVIAVWLDLRLSKDEILTAYLNNIYFGAGANGVAQASQVYFNKQVRDLDISESVMLAGLIHAPTRLNPQQNLEQARRRATQVLFAMVEQGFISREAAVVAALDAAAPVPSNAIAQAGAEPAAASAPPALRDAVSPAESEPVVAELPKAEQPSGALVPAPPLVTELSTPRASPVQESSPVQQTASLSAGGVADDERVSVPDDAGPVASAPDETSSPEEPSASVPQQRAAVRSAPDDAPPPEESVAAVSSEPEPEAAPAPVDTAPEVSSTPPEAEAAPVATVSPPRPRPSLPSAAESETAAPAVASTPPLVSKPAARQLAPKPQAAQPRVAKRKAEPKTRSAAAPTKPQIAARKAGPKAAQAAKPAQRSRLSERRAFAEAYAAEKRAAAERRAGLSRPTGNRSRPGALLGGRPVSEQQPVVAPSAKRRAAPRGAAVLRGRPSVSESRLADNGPAILLGGRARP